jgi:hypothetical protein
MQFEQVDECARRAADLMLEAGEAAEAFSLRDLRRTVETTLARLGVSQDLRAQIQSHGLAGIQQKHYNRHDYRREKHDTLELWSRWLTEGAQRETKVVARGRQHDLGHDQLSEQLRLTVLGDDMHPLLLA